MVVQDEWRLVYYIDATGNSPVEEFITNLDPKTRSRLDWSLERLRVQNVQARFPLVRQIDGKLWELREESRTNIYRVFYFFLTGRRIVLLHAFQKKSVKTPPREIDTATKRMNELVVTEGGENS